MALKAGSLKPKKKEEKQDHYSGSLAEAIEKAMKAEWQHIMPGDMASSKEMKLLFTAVAQGLVGYLKKHMNDGLEVKVTTSNGHTHTVTIALKTEDILHPQ